MIFSDVEIKTANAVGNISITPFRNENVQPNSYEVTLDKEIFLVKNGGYTKIMLPYTIKTGEFVLGSTKESLELRRDTCAMVSGKSTLGRHGVSVHQTAGFIDCGFNGTITLELFNVGPDYELKEGMKIAQIIFFNTKTPQKKYGECDNHYQNQKGVTLPYDVMETKPKVKKNEKQ